MWLMRFQSLEGSGFFTKYSVSEVALFSHKAGRRFISNSGFYCSFHHDEAGIIKCFCFIWTLWNDEAGINNNFWIYPHHPATMREVRHRVYMIIYSPWFSNFIRFILKNVKTVVRACDKLKSLCKRPWGSSKEFFLIFFSLPDVGGEKKICQFLSISVDFWKFWLRQGRLSWRWGSWYRSNVSVLLALYKTGIALHWDSGHRQVCHGIW